MAGAGDSSMLGGLDLGGARSGIRQARQLVVRDQEAWARLWSEHTGPGGSPAPAVDFAAEDVVAVFAGARPTGGHRVRIDRIGRDNDAANVHVTLLRPAPGTLTTQAFTYPFAMRSAAKLPRTVQFVLTEEPARP